MGGMGGMGGDPGMMMMSPNMKVGPPIKGMPGMVPVINKVDGEDMVVGFMPMQMAAAMGLQLVGASPAMGSGTSTASVDSKPSPPPLTDKETPMDPDVRELGEYFSIEERWVVRLNEEIHKRQESKEVDLAKLYEVLETARSPTGLLTVKIGEMASGRFIGKIKHDKDVERIAKKFKLDDPVKSRLTELTVRAKDRKEEHMDRLEQHLSYCKQPNAIATILCGKLLEGKITFLPDLKEAKKMMDKHSLDEDAKSKLREICEKRSDEMTEVLAEVERHIDGSWNASATLCKIARYLIAGEECPPPPERKGGDKGGGKGKDGKDDGDRRSRNNDDRNRDYDGDRRDRDRSRDRDRDRRDRRDRSRDRDRDR